MTTICLIRHGETDWNAIGRIQGRTDIPLNEKGIRQAQLCRDFFKGSTEWDVIITSTLQRARQTAEIINESIGLSFLEMEEFVERGFGEVEGMTIEERTKLYPDGQYPNQEDVETLLNRLMSGLKKIQQEYENKKVLLVVHGAVINAILDEVSNGKLGYGKSRLRNASFSHIHFENGEWELQKYNQVSHLTPEFISK
ncbi:histidine phosphatase family protein [Ferdinandcohnia quinoae]|uniref:Histidine phosphatase family protein n=1 Tax=Fredinandcohnia quinoae TaxID=2918902 RepID=A0AAW5EC97_9BACI|nr:histidine phosphatase family protein [Fredinandcohnia sp. SECRCQ15]MCH1626394.1 histidine phosphatase family protein [Fredinandcohnia sp. SECRCQ15]